MAEIPRPEYPRPQFARSEWLNLNGYWTCEFDPGRSGVERGLAQSRGFDRRILVPFCPESRLSGLGHVDFIERLWYHRTIEIPAAWQGKKILLHFGGVDYEAEVFLDGERVGHHWGGGTSWSVDITSRAQPGKTHHLVIHVRDELRAGGQPAGKQASSYKSAGCHYTRTTGIWSTVWLEAVHPQGLAGVQIIPVFDEKRFIFVPAFYAEDGAGRWRATVRAEGRTIGSAEGAAINGNALIITPNEIRPWSPSSPFLYDVIFEVIASDGKKIDEVISYAGLRKVHCANGWIYLNNEPIYLRFVLDQGFYPDGIWTAPDDAALKRDIELALAAGFNGARLHQKVFEERFHYWADRLGYLTWAEFPSWGTDCTSAASGRAFLAEWADAICRDRNHPSIIAWTPLNETVHTGPDGREHRRLHQDAYELTHRLDPTRPVNDASGYVHVRTDLWTVHNYEQDPEKLRRALTPESGVFRNYPDREAAYGGQPYLVDEFGGIRWTPAERRAWADNSWGYGSPPQTPDEFYRRLEGLVRALRSVPHVAGFCYTQLTDVEQEENGIYNYDRSPKFDMAIIRRIFGL